MQFSTSFIGLLMASMAFAIPTARAPATDIVSRDLCHVGVPCIVQYEVNVALAAVDQAVADVQADVKAVLSPTGPVFVALKVAIDSLTKAVAEVEAEIGPLSADAKAEVSAYVVAAISTLVAEIKAGLSVVVSVSTTVVVTVSPQVQESVDAILTLIAAIEAVVGPCYPATKL